MTPDRFVLDASVAMSWCFEDEAEGYADGILDKLVESEALAPSVWPLEVANVIVVAERRGRLRPTESSRFLHLLRSLPIEVIQEPSEGVTGEILALAREQDLSSYDASYLDLAMREGLPIATLDASLRSAALRCSVPLVLVDRTSSEGPGR